MFLLLTELLFDHDVFSVQHLLNIHLPLPLHLRLHPIILLLLLYDALPVFTLVLVLRRFTPLFHPPFLCHGTLQTCQLRIKHYRRGQESATCRRVYCQAQLIRKFDRRTRHCYCQRRGPLR